MATVGEIETELLMINIILFGPPGAGKGTQSEKIISKYQLTHLSTGGLLRRHLSEGTDLGKMAQTFLDAGNLLPDEVVVNMVERRITDFPEARGFIFDGFPRTVPQARSLDFLMEELRIPMNQLIALEVPEEELRARLMKRGLTSGRSDDQDEDKINHRIKVYQDETFPVAEYYREQGKYSPITGIGSIDEIFSNISSVIDSYH